MRPARALFRTLARAFARARVLRVAGALCLVCTLAFTLACASPAVRPPPRPAPAPDAPRVHDPLEAPWTVERRAGSFVNTLRFSAEIVSRVDSVELHDSSTAIIGVSWSRLAVLEPTRLSGLVTDFRVGSGTLDPQPLGGLLLPVPFAAVGSDEAGVPRIEVPPSGACGLAAISLQPLRELFVSPPPRLVVGTSWSDSSSYAICRDSIPLAVTSVRRYRVVGAERRADGVVVVVDRTSRVILLGEGVQFGERLSLAAEGSGSMRLELDPASSTIRAARGDADLTMTMRGRRRSQELRQHTRIEITSP